jgi:hypothetical protein
MAESKDRPIRLAPDFSGPSIQGEQQARAGAAVWADQSEVDAYVATQPDDTLACRSRGRHTYEQLRKSERMRFSGVTAEGFLVRMVPCEVCGKVWRVEEWDVRHRKDRIIRMDLVRAYPKYGPGYLGKPGQGRMKPRQIQSATGTAAMHDLSYRQVRKEAVEAAQRSA